MHPEHIRNGMPASDLGGEGWHKPWSDNGGDCLEAKKLPGGRRHLHARHGQHVPQHLPLGTRPGGSHRTLQTPLLQGLHYCKAFGIPPGQFGTAEAQPATAGSAASGLAVSPSSPVALSQAPSASAAPGLADPRLLVPVAVAYRGSA
jgi:hypothetical protein